MAVAVTQTFNPGPRLIDGTDLNTLVGQINAALADVGSATVVIPVATLASLANAEVLDIPVAYPFKVTKAQFRVGVAATTAAKAATLTTRVNDVAVTGGVIALTSANCTPSGAVVAGSAITGANTGTAGQTVGVVVSAVTAFVEGSGQIEFTVVNTSIQ